MQITNISIKRYGSIKEVDFPVSNLTILVGKNGSGKSFILESLYRFFTDFNSLGGGITGGTSDYLWFERDASEPIEIGLDFQLTDDEVAKIFPFTAPNIDLFKERIGKDFTNLKIVRTIDLGSGWHTKIVQWGNIEFVSGDKPISINELNSALFPYSNFGKYVVYFFENGRGPTNIGGPRLLVDTEKKVAYNCSPQIDQMISQNVIRSDLSTYNQDFRSWATQNGYTLNERVPDQSEVPETVSINPQNIQDSLTNLTNTLRNKFKLIPAIRDNRVQAGIRQPFLDPQLLQVLTQLSVATARPDEIRWTDFRRIAEKLLDKRLEPNPGQILIHDQELRLPTAHIGGGEQSLIGLMWLLSEPNVIFGVEEPEGHLHADLIKTFFMWVREVSKTTQVFLITHSPLMVDKSLISNNWMVSKDSGETKIIRLKEKEDFRTVLHQLGILPSDIYLSDAVVFVEGGTEKEAVFPVWAKKLGLEMDDKIAIISLGGASKLKDNLRIWLDIAKYAPVDYQILLDKDAQSLAFEIAKKMDISLDKFHIIEKGTVEDYYPTSLIKEALAEIFEIKVTDEEIGHAKSKADFMEKILQKNNKLKKHWKILIGEYIAEKMNVEQIPDKVKEIVDILKST